MNRQKQPFMKAKVRNSPFDRAAFHLQYGRFWSFDHSHIVDGVGDQGGVQLGKDVGDCELEYALALCRVGDWAGELNAGQDKGILRPEND
jgi:hypothetical protein